MVIISRGNVVILELIPPREAQFRSKRVKNRIPWPGGGWVEWGDVSCFLAEFARKAAYVLFIVQDLVAAIARF